MTQEKAFSREGGTARAIRQAEEGTITVNVPSNKEKREKKNSFALQEKKIPPSNSEKGRKGSNFIISEHQRTGKSKAYDLLKKKGKGKSGGDILGGEGVSLRTRSEGKEKKRRSKREDGANGRGKRGRTIARAATDNVRGSVATRAVSKRGKAAAFSNGEV